MKRKTIIIMCCITVLMSFSVPSVVKAQKDQADDVQQQMAKIKPYEGEITDEMIESFIKADSQIRMLRQQISQVTQKILDDENITPEAYITIAQKLREDEQLRGRIRSIAKTLRQEQAKTQKVQAVTTE